MPTVCQLCGRSECRAGDDVCPWLASLGVKAPGQYHPLDLPYRQRKKDWRRKRPVQSREPIKWERLKGPRRPNRLQPRPSPEPVDWPTFTGICTYCGLPASAMDHILPKPWTGESPRRDHLVPTVPSCGECNSLLSDLFLPRVTLRRAYIAEELQHRYARLLSQPCDGYLDIEPGLFREQLGYQLFLRAQTEARIAFAGSRASS